MVKFVIESFVHMVFIRKVYPRWRMTKANRTINVADKAWTRKILLGFPSQSKFGRHGWLSSRLSQIEPAEATAEREKPHIPCM